MTGALELTPWEYAHIAKLDDQTKVIAVTCPFKSIVTYAGYSPHRLKELLAGRNRDHGELQQCVLHYLAMHVVIAKQSVLRGFWMPCTFRLGRAGCRDLANYPSLSSPQQLGEPSSRPIDYRKHGAFGEECIRRNRQRERYREARRSSEGTLVGVGEAVRLRKIPSARPPNRPASLRKRLV